MKKEEMVKYMVGSEIYVGDLENMAIVTSAIVFEEVVFEEIGVGIAGKIFIKYPDLSEIQEHNIIIHKGEDMKEDGYICTRNLDYKEGEDDELTTLFMSEMLS